MGKKDTPEIASINFLGKGTSIKGDISSNGDIRIDGIVTGVINSTGKVVVGSSGRVDGEIVCMNAEVEGTLKVKINVTELLSLKATSNVKGELVTGKLAIEPGALFSGTCRMEDEKKPEIKSSTE
ncbi:MAG: polymer-forming cytoskeletal protein [Bacteroidales bacterium]|nr:polymer-forming cytoskeletal protein [Bacteroidales bacterium]MDZ4203510.1 polymer-forming cytoskeletal protein [Bacteroidales bacterium]